MQVLTNKLKPSPTQIYLLARALDENIKEFYKDQENEKAFQNWMSSRGKQNESEID